MAKYTKEQAIKIITNAAEKYRDELANNTLMFVCTDKHKRVVFFEFSFYNWNFKHLTGVKTKNQEDDNKEHISAINFYNKCLSHKLSPDDFEFSDDGTTHLKLDIISSVLCKNLAAKMIGILGPGKPYLQTDRIAGGTKACIGFVVDSIKECYVPNTLLKDNILNIACSYVRVIATLRKPNSEKKYNELTYRAKNVEWDKIKLPDEIEYLSSFFKNDKDCL